MFTIQINNREIKAKKGEMILDTLNREGISVPTLCYMKDLFPTGACRMCVVEIEGYKGLVPSCAMPVAEGMKIQTHSPKAIKARKTIIELLLADHPDDCLYCVRNGNCQLQDLAEELGVRQRRFTGKKSTYEIDASSPSILRDPAKCILCGKCVRVCEEIQGVSAIDFVERGCRTEIGTAFREGLNVSSCINCGQCILACPTGALREKSNVKEVMDALNDPKKHVVVQHAPSISVTIGEEFGIKPGKDVAGLMVAAMRRLGFDAVFDTSFTADLTIMEEATELVNRIKNGGPMPMTTSCSPGWVKFVEQFYPQLLPNVSTCKSPMQMLGAVIKSYYAEKAKIDPKDIYSVAIMPCSAKKFEAERPEMMNDMGQADIDAVLSTREFARVIKMRGLDLNNMEPDIADNPFAERSSAGKLFGATGGVAEAALRTAYKLITGENLKDPVIKELRGLDGIKEVKVQVGDLLVGVAVVSGLANARKILDQVVAGRKDLHFIEVMTCPGGCINGGGQPLTMDMEAIKARLKALYDLDRDAELRTSHDNKHIQKLYEEYLGEPNGHRSHKLLHTHYVKRDVLK
ncbi:MAG: iron hydrogenase small subunit [Candidatus Marinimicrobia bacterium]|nr:iron hydrogenase small subunit [Candidatus Neomarinimicrobiota bacterium]